MRRDEKSDIFLRIQRPTLRLPISPWGSNARYRDSNNARVEKPDIFLRIQREISGFLQAEKRNVQRRTLNAEWGSGWNNLNIHHWTLDIGYCVSNRIDMAIVTA